MPAAFCLPARCLLCCGAALLAGCGVKPLQVHDTDAPHALVRASLRPGGVQGGGGVELELMRVRGESFQQLAEGDFVDLGEVALNGPLQLRNTARSQSLQLVYHHRLFAGQPFEMAWFVGATTGNLDWTSHEQGSGGQRASTRVRWTGPTGGVSGRWNMAPQWFGELRYAGTLAPSGGEFSARGQIELALAWQAAPALQLRLGYANTELKIGPRERWSELSFRGRGPFAGLVLGY